MSKDILVLGFAILALGISAAGTMPNYDSPERIALAENYGQWYDCPVRTLEFTVPPYWTLEELNEKIDWLEHLVADARLIEHTSYRDSCLMVPKNTGIAHVPISQLSIREDAPEKTFKGVDISLEKALEVYRRQRDDMANRGYSNTTDYIADNFDPNLYRARTEVIRWMLDCPVLSPEERNYWVELGNCQGRERPAEPEAWTGYSTWWDGWSNNDWHYDMNWTRWNGSYEYYVQPATGDVVRIYNYYSGGASPTFCRITNGNTNYLYRMYVHYQSGARTLELTNNRWLYVGRAGEPNYEYEMWVEGGSTFRQQSGYLRLYNGNTSTGTGEHGSTNTGCCLTVDGTFDLNGGTCYIDDDLIIHGTVDQDGGTIYTGYDSHDGAVWVSGSSGLYARYYMAGSSRLDVERYIFTSGYNSSPWGYGLGTGRFQASGGSVRLTNGSASTGRVYVYDGGSSHSFFNDVYVDGNTYIDATSGNYMYINGSLYPSGGSLYPVDRIRFSSRMADADVTDDAYPAESVRNETTSGVSENARVDEFYVNAGQTSEKASFEIGIPEPSEVRIGLYDCTGRRISSRRVSAGYGVFQTLSIFRLCPAECIYIESMPAASTRAAG